MKPCRALSLTDEELKPWQQVKDRIGYPACNVFAHHSRESDRRDAEKMFQRMEWQARCFKNGYDWRTERRGWFPSDWSAASDEYLNPVQIGDHFFGGRL
jgi:hypothetical protein